MQRDGWILLDCRLANNFENAHIEGSVSVPLYRGVEGRSMMDQVKRLAMASFAMTATGVHIRCCKCCVDACVHELCV